jgi:antitoxin ParD1/3/4
MDVPSELTIRLDPDAAAIVREAVAAGEYASEEKVVEAALLAWAEARAVDGIGDEILRGLWEEGIASGPGRYNDIEEIKAEARRRLQDTAPKA